MCSPLPLLDWPSTDPSSSSSTSRLPTVCCSWAESSTPPRNKTKATQLIYCFLPCKNDVTHALCIHHNFSPSCMSLAPTALFVFSEKCNIYDRIKTAHRKTSGVDVCCSRYLLVNGDLCWSCEVVWWCLTAGKHWLFFSVAWNSLMPGPHILCEQRVCVARRPC